MILQYTEERIDAEIICDKLKVEFPTFTFSLGNRSLIGWSVVCNESANTDTLVKMVFFARGIMSILVL
jgi:hypothetical protein